MNQLESEGGDVTHLNLTSLYLSDEVHHLKRLLRYAEMFLDFSYYSGFVIAGFNFTIFLLATILYSQVGVNGKKHLAMRYNFFLERFAKNFFDVYCQPGVIRHHFTTRYESKKQNIFF